MKLSFTTLACPDWTLEQAFNNGAAYGYDGVEIESMDGHRLATPQLLKENVRRIRRLSETSGCRSLSILSHIQLAREDMEEQAEALSEAQLYLELLGDLDTEYLRVMGNWTLEKPNEEWLIDTASDSLSSLADMAADLNAKIVLETHDCFRDARMLCRVLERVDSPQVFALWDTQHSFRGGQTPAEVWSNLSNWVAHVHVKDARRNIGTPPAAGSKPEVQAHDIESWEAVPIGDGEIPIRDSLRVLADGGYDGFVSYEWEKHDHPNLADPEVELPAGAAKIREYLSATIG